MKFSYAIAFFGGKDMRKKGFLKALKNIRREICCGVMALAVFGTLTSGSVVQAADHQELPKPALVYIPIDNRPITDIYTADTIAKAGCKILVPPDELLGGADTVGESDKLWSWLDKTLQDNPDIRAAVLSSDSLIYGSLVTSRKHNLSQGELQARVNRLADLRKKYPNVKSYVFSSIMRTPSINTNSGGKEPDYYMECGSSIFRLTGLLDKEEMEGLTAAEAAEKAQLESSIKPEYLQDWMTRRDKNFAVNKQLIDLDRQRQVHYLALGRDDNAPLSQTHREGRKLKEYGSDLDFTAFQNMSGIDEIGMLLLAKAANDAVWKMPFVHVVYQEGVGGDTVPSFSDEKIDTTVDDYIHCLGGFRVKSPKRADVVMMVNTPLNGVTAFTANQQEDSASAQATERFVQQVQDRIAQGQPVGIADIACYNGSDIGLMKKLSDRNMLFDLKVYGGWNTATNSLGFALGQGAMVPWMSLDDKDKLLMIRYLDDWGYQAVVRQELSPFADRMPKYQKNIEAIGTQQLQIFSLQYLPLRQELFDVTMELPWNRLFENRVRLNTPNGL